MYRGQHNTVGRVLCDIFVVIGEELNE